MTTALILLPVLGILLWLYFYLLPGRQWKYIDSILVGAVLILAAGFVEFASGIPFEGAGTMWPQIVSAAGTYAILAAGLGAALWWRRRRKTK